jgi:hypothetical protein
MSAVLTVKLTPHERMSEIRRLTGEMARIAVEAGGAALRREHGVSDDLWGQHDALIVELLQHLEWAEERGELFACETFLKGQGAA